MNRLFPRYAVGLLISSVAALFALSLILSAHEDTPSRGESAGPGVNSVSAVGYAGIYDVMRRMDIPAKRSAKNPLRDAGKSGVLVVAEPAIRLGLSPGSGSYRLDDAKKLLFVLPKWKWRPDPEKPSWVSEMSAHDISEAQTVLSLITIDGSSVFREDAPDIWTTNEFQFSPEISGVAQMLHPSARMRTLVGGENGALLAEITEDGRTVWILTDPDVMSNHGFMKGDNAAFMISVIQSLSETGNGDSDGPVPVVFDETIHGFISENDSLLKMVLSFPYAIVTILGVLSAVLFALAGAGRFGVPETAERAIDFGKAQLIDNGARLLDYGGHHAAVLGRYVRMTVSETARALHVPENPDIIAAAEMADRIGESRHVSLSCLYIVKSLLSLERSGGKDVSGMMEAARMAYKWKGEILNGSAIHRERS
jgi:hypothetical protein